ncbi:MAG: SOS response-associated peptidase [Myxococcales bacterium]|nr:SOS response-associated peptidase [Myxococcales bacterium]
MCGRYALITVGDELAAALGLADVTVHARARYNIAPSQPVPVVTAAEPRRLVLMRWGLAPPWKTKDQSGARPLINARAESLAERPTFREPLRRHRCLVPADGFYEWQRQGNRRQAWYFYRRDRRPFVFAGVYVPVAGGGEDVGTVAIVTCAPNSVLAPVHDRMPVLLAEGARQVWLSAEDRVAELLRLLQPFPSAEMAGHPVSAAVNTPRADGADLIRPLPQKELQFQSPSGGPIR